VGDGKNDEEDYADDDGDRDEDDDDRPSRMKTRKKRPRVRRASRKKRPDPTRTDPKTRSARWRPGVCAAPLSRENHRPPIPSPLRSRPPPRTDRRLPSCKRTRTTVIVSCPAVAPMAHTSSTSRATAKGLSAAPRHGPAAHTALDLARLGSQARTSLFPLRVITRCVLHTYETLPPSLADCLPTSRPHRHLSDLTSTNAGNSCVPGTLRMGAWHIKVC